MTFQIQNISDKTWIYTPAIRQSGFVSRHEDYDKTIKNTQISIDIYILKTKLPTFDFNMVLLCIDVRQARIIEISTK